MVKSFFTANTPTEATATITSFYQPTKIFLLGYLFNQCLVMNIISFDFTSFLIVGCNPSWMVIILTSSIAPEDSGSLDLELNKREKELRERRVDLKPELVIC